MILALRGLCELLEFGFKVFKVLATAVSRTCFALMTHELQSTPYLEAPHFESNLRTITY